MRAWLAFAVCVVALVAAATGANGAVVGHACAGIKQCIAVTGPWVVVPATGETDYLLECPKRQGVVGGTDARASSQDVHASFDGITGSPVAYGRTTTRYAFFRAVTGLHRTGSFQPLLGCIPSPSGAAVTTAVKVTPIGPPLDLAQVTIPVAPGLSGKHTLACQAGEHLVDSWDATDFRTTGPPNVALADAIHVTRTIKGGTVAVSIAVSKSLPAGAHAEVQLGVRCATE